MADKETNETEAPETEAEEQAEAQPLPQLVAVQTDTVWEDAEANYARVRGQLDAADLKPGSLVVLQEMFPSGFTMNVDKVAEKDPSASEAFLAEQAKERGIYLLGGVVRRGPFGAVRNQSVVCSPEGALVSRYTKIQGFTLGGESDAYAPGDEVVLFAWNGFNVAHFICYDLRFPELFRAAAKLGADAYTVIASWPNMRHEHWTHLLKARAIENQAYVVGVNRCGGDPSFSYDGGSRIVDYSGAILADAGKEEGVVSAEADIMALRDYRKKLPFLEDIRDDFVASPL